MSCDHISAYDYEALTWSSETYDHILFMIKTLAYADITDQTMTFQFVYITVPDHVTDIHRLVIMVMWHWHMAILLFIWYRQNCDLIIFINVTLPYGQIIVFTFVTLIYMTQTYGPMKVCGSRALPNDHITAYDLNVFFLHTTMFWRRYTFNNEHGLNYSEK